jgi:F0F1-type ATP synthase membrane subunit b/b'
MVEFIVEVTFDIAAFLVFVFLVVKFVIKSKFQIEVRD